MIFFEADVATLARASVRTDGTLRSSRGPVETKFAMTLSGADEHSVERWNAQGSLINT